MAQETGMVVSQTRELLPEPSVLNSLYEVARRIIGTPLAPKSITTPEAAFAIMLKGREIGMPVMASLSGIYIIGGKASLYADAMLGLVYRDHGDNAIIVTKTTDKECVIVYKRQGWKDTQTHTYTMDMAVKAKITTGNVNWELRPANMLRARCISEVCRMAFADSIAGLYTVEEMQDVAAADARDITPDSVGVSVVEQPVENTQPAAKPKPGDSPPAPDEWIKILSDLQNELHTLTGEAPLSLKGITQAQAKERKAYLTASIAEVTAARAAADEQSEPGV